jgi:hypothetical protein
LEVAFIAVILATCSEIRDGVITCAISGSTAKTITYEGITIAKSAAESAETTVDPAPLEQEFDELDGLKYI